MSNSDRCKFYVKHKRRFCKLTAQKLNGYCTEHSFLSPEANDRKRILCPLDPKHSVFEDELEKHVKRCNSRLDLLPDCYEKNINCGEEDESIDPRQYQVTLRLAEEDEVLQLIDKVRELHAAHIGDQLQSETLFHDVMRSQYEDPKNGASAHKHILQQASLIAHMDRLGFLDDNHCFMEFGCGKGGLSHWVQLAVREKCNTQFVLVDKSSVRYKMDNYHKGAEQGPNFERIKIDIEHLNICKLQNLNNDRPIVTIGKHLCGAATDLMLRCLTRLAPHNVHKRHVLGVVLALCCHHRCHWRSYVGKDFMQRQCGINARQFHIIASMSSWATCSSRPIEHDELQERTESYSHRRSGNLLPQQRELVGNMCKQLIDYGRAQYLEQHGFRCQLNEFIDKYYTLENCCLLAKRQSSD